MSEPRMTNVIFQGTRNDYRPGGWSAALKYGLHGLKTKIDDLPINDVIWILVSKDFMKPVLKWTTFYLLDRDLFYELKMAPVTLKGLKGLWVIRR